MTENENPYRRDNEGNLTIECCKNCKYIRFNINYDENSDLNNSELCCCRRAPIDRFPFVEEKNWCGEWKFCEDVDE